MADTLIAQGNQAAQNVAPTLTPAQQSLSDNAKIPAGQVGSPWTAPTQNSTSPTVMAPTQAFNNSPIPVPAVTSPDPSSGIVAGANQTATNLQNTITSLTPQETELDKQNQSLLDNISTLTGQDSGKDQALLDKQKETGATQDQADLTALNNQLLTKTAQYNQQFASLYTQPGVTSAVANAQNAGLKISQAADIGLLTAQIQAKQGDLKLALDTAKSAVDARYSTIEDNIKTKQAQLNALAPQLDKQQKTLALAQQKVLQDQADKVAKEKEDAKTNLSTALSQGVTTQFANQNGKFFDARTGQTFEDPAAFFKAAGVTSFEQAYQQGLITDITQNKIDDRNAVLQLQNKFGDAGIKSTDTLDQATAKLKNSALYHKDTYIAPNAYTNSGGHYVAGADPVVDGYVNEVKNGESLTTVPIASRGLVVEALNQAPTIVDSSTDSQVKAIIAANPGQYGNAADAIDKAFGPGTAAKYDTQLKAVYNQGQDVGSAFAPTTYSALAGTRFTREANAITKNFLDLPGYQLTANGLPYIQRIAAAVQTPGSVSDQELLDAMTKLSTSGNAVTDAQIKIITGGKSYADTINTFQNKLKNGGILSENQRKDLVKTANDIYDQYKKGYQPIYDQVTKQFDQAGIPKAFRTIPDLNALSAAAGTTTQSRPANVPANYIQVKQKSDGQSGWIDPSEYDASKYDKVSFNKVGGDTNALASSLVSRNPSPYGIIAGYDITSYATDPNHEKSVYNLYNKIPAISDASTADNYIRSVASGSPVRGQDVLDASKQYGVDPKLVIALMQQDSTLGTKGKAVRTNNPGNVGNTDSGSTQGFKSVRDGVFAVAKNLSKRRVNSSNLT